ncbi:MULTISPECIES: YigZ family protein [Clostridium]|uniref:YigZ family protein n=1 Tax=Clostridium TaxID=1485 RepID=UPI0008258FCB|nr:MULTISPECIES: YigZ family protein [Clostridium]PJI09745.1 YigZ family protein [Clostridium sp. CT7]
MDYLTVRREAEVQFEEKKSIFIGHIKRVESEEEAKEFVERIKSEHKDATHNVPAYIVGENRMIQRYSDNGEPQGTAGIPVLEVIKKNGITDTAIVVTRYFGGILLGAGGLVRAYSKSAADAVKESGIVLKVKGVPLVITINYDLLGKIQYLFSNKNWHVENIEYTDEVKILFNCELDKLSEVKKEVTEICHGTSKFNIGEEKYYFKGENRLFTE